jgi:hypothetical protein
MLEEGGGGNWVASLNVGGKQKTLGEFSREREAAECYDAKKIIYLLL